MTRHSTSMSAAIALATAVALVSFGWPLRASARADVRSSAAGDHADPCEHLPHPPGKAHGIHKRCDRGGSGSGVAKGDFNGDGFADLAIGEPDATIGGAVGAGDVIVVYGSTNGLAAHAAGTPSRQLFYEGRDLPGVPAAWDGFATALASGDFNGDGYSDLAIGIPGKLGLGAVVVIYGSVTGLTATDASVPAPQYFDVRNAHRDFRIVDNVNVSPWFGQSLAWGDFNHDGKGELAVGIPGYANCFEPTCLSGDYYSNGAVWVIGGSGSGLTLSGNQLWTAQDFPSDGGAESGFASSLAAGDFNGDGYFDLAIGEPDKGVANCPGPFGVIVDCEGAGAVGIIYGGSFGLDPANGPLGGAQFVTQQSPGILGSAETGDHFGAALAAGDFNGDGCTDLAIGVPNEDVEPITDAGVVNVLYGSSAGLTRTGNQLWDQNALAGLDEVGAEFGAALAAGDFNGDGRIDLAVGVPFKDIVGTVNAGEVDVIYGAPAGLSATTTRAPQVLHASAPQRGSQFGATLTAWNFGRNEVKVSNGHITVVPTADLAIAAPFATVNGKSEAGAVTVLYGSSASNGLISAASTLVTGDSVGLGSQAGAHFGKSLY